LHFSIKNFKTFLQNQKIHLFRLFLGKNSLKNSKIHSKLSQAFFTLFSFWNAQISFSFAFSLFGSCARDFNQNQKTFFIIFMSFSTQNFLYFTTNWILKKINWNFHTKTKIFPFSNFRDCSDGFAKL
jgi:hypothetical protein